MSHEITTRALCAFPLLLGLVVPAAAQDVQSAEATSQQDEPRLAPPAERFPRWTERDAEGRWVLVARDLAADADSVGYWVEEAYDARDVELLEWLALTEPYGSGAALDALVLLDAPAWMAVTVWRGRSSSSHSVAASRRHLEARPLLARAWLTRHASALPAGVREDLQSTLPATLDLVDPAAVARLTPPIDPAPLLAALHGAGAAVDFGERLTAQEGQLYLHQVERALQALVGTEQPPAGFAEALLALARQHSDALAVMAGRTFAARQPADIPAEELFDLAADATRGAAAREALFLGASYGPDAVVWVHLHAALENPRDVTWDAAVARLGEVGDRFTLERIGAIDEGALLEGQARRLENASSSIQGQVLQGESTDAATARKRAEYARSIGHPLAPALAAFAEKAGR